MDLTLAIELKSATTFGRGDGVAGLVDAELEHDHATGLPYLRGRSLKGLLVEACSEILFALREAGSPGLGDCSTSAQRLFGGPGSGLNDGGCLRVGNAEFPADLREAVAAAIAARQLTAQEVLESLTTIRRQTAVNEAGAPEETSLRSLRVLLAGTTLRATLSLPDDPPPADLALLAACVLALRRGGTGRNRGRGRLLGTLEDRQANVDLERFAALAKGAAQ